MTAPCYTPSVGNLRVWVPGEKGKLCCLVTLWSLGFTSSVRPLRNTLRSEKRDSFMLQSQLRHEILIFHKLFCSFPVSCVMLQHWHQWSCAFRSARWLDFNCGRSSSLMLFLLFIAQSELVNTSATSVVLSEYWCWYIFVVDSLVIKSRCLHSNR